MLESDPSPPETTDTRTPFERFRDAARKVVTTPKEEVDALAQREKEAKERNGHSRKPRKLD